MSRRVCATSSGSCLAVWQWSRRLDGTWGRLLVVYRPRKTKVPALQRRDLND